MAVRNATARLIPDQRRPLAVEFPIRNQKLHRRGVVTRAIAEAFVALVRLLDLRHVDLDTEAGPLGNGDEPAHDPERLFRQTLAVLPDPMGVDCRDASRRGGGAMRKHRERMSK